MKRHVIYIIMLLVASMPAWSQEEDSMELDSLLEEMVYEMETSIGTSICDKKCDDVISYSKNHERASETYYTDAMFYAVTMKLTSYQMLSQYEKLMTCADSVLEMTDFNGRTEYYYYYIIYVKALSYIDQGKYKLAIQCAKQLYDDGKEIPDYRNFDPDVDNVPQAARNRCNALVCMGQANREMGLYGEALDNFDECVELASHYSMPMMSLKFDVQVFRLETSLKCEPREKTLAYVDAFAEELKRFDSEKDEQYGMFSTVTYEASVQSAYVEIYCDLNQPDKARLHLDELQRVIDENELTGQSMTDLRVAKAIYYKTIGQNVMAMAFADSAAMIYKEVSKPNMEVEMLKMKLDAMHSALRYSEEYDVAQRIIAVSDSLAKQKYNSQIEEQRTIMDVDKLNNEKKTLTAQRQLFLTVSVLVVVLALFVIFYLNYRRGKERQKILSQQKELLEAEVERQTYELRQQKDEIEQKNRDITDSINYAERIQSKILPDLSQYKNYGVEGAFAFFIPCNIVSGDFYWATREGERLVIACSDCTGHGVPGAFVSMIGSTSLNEISTNPEITEPGDMLEALDSNVMKVLGQSGGEARDGMDIALIAYEPGTGKVKCAGARRPVYVIRKNGEIEEFKGVKRSIGETDEGSRAKPFETMEFEVEKGDTIYMCSDGLADQFGGQEIHGENGKRLMSGGLKKMLMKINAESIENQRDMAEKLYWEWRGTCPQLDDISLVGVRI